MFKIPKYQLYLLQLENYEFKRFWKLLFKKGLWPKGEQRKSLVWTGKAILIFVVAEILIFCLAALVALAVHSHVLENTVATAFVFFGTVVILKLFCFLFFSLAVVLIWPVDFLLKQWIVAKAKSKIQKLTNLKTIGIAGSYGKTTMKEVLRQVLGARFKVLATPESVNTPVGIARWILKEVNESTEILVVEMGEHYKGDITELSQLTPPDIAVVTGINEAHMERMGSMENIAASILEIEKFLKRESLMILNLDDSYIFAHKDDQKPFKKSFYSYYHPESTGFFFENVHFNTEKLVWNFDIPAAQQKIQLALMGEYAMGLAVAAIQVIGHLRADINIAQALAKVKPIPHRLEPIKRAGDILVIDDAYNGNSAGAAEAIKVLQRFKDRRKIYITPGLVETGSKTREVHLEIGRQLASVVNVVILIKNSVTADIELGIKNYESGIKKPEIIWFSTAQEAHASLGKILKPGDVVLFQNDWGDQYL